MSIQSTCISSLASLRTAPLTAADSARMCVSVVTVCGAAIVPASQLVAARCLSACAAAACWCYVGRASTLAPPVPADAVASGVAPGGRLHGYYTTLIFVGVAVNHITCALLLTCATAIARLSLDSTGHGATR
jgi:hypothetical protein